MAAIHALRTNSSHWLMVQSWTYLEHTRKYFLHQKGDSGIVQEFARVNSDIPFPPGRTKDRDIYICDRKTHSFAFLLFWIWLSLSRKARRTQNGSNSFNHHHILVPRYLIPTSGSTLVWRCEQASIAILQSIVESMKVQYQNPSLWPWYLKPLESGNHERCGDSSASRGCLSRLMKGAEVPTYLMARVNALLLLDSSN